MTFFDARKAGLADRVLGLRTADLVRFEDRLQFFDVGEPAVAGTASVVDSSAAWVELGPSREARYFSRTQPRSWVTGSDTYTQLPSRLMTCKSVPGG